MPEIIQLKNGNQIRNKYNAAGQKLSSRNITVEAGVYQPLNRGDIIENPDVNENDNVTVEGMDHIGNMEYYSGRYFDWDVTFEPVEYHSLYRIHNPEGYATSATTSNGPIYYYYRRDHLGNNREVWRASYTWGSTTHAAATVQRTQYYPSGLPWKYFSGDNPGSQPYKYNGKEFVEMHGLDEYYYIFRNYQPSTMRFTTSDPLAELTPGISPYAYCFNNPVRFIDPLGLTGHDTTKDMYGRNKYDSFTGMYIPPMDRPGGMTNQGYGKLDFGYYQLTYAGYKASNSWSVTTPDGHTTYHFIDSEPVFNYEWIWYPHEEKMYGMPREGGYDLRRAASIVGYGGLSYTGLEKMTIPGHKNYFLGQNGKYYNKKPNGITGSKKIAIKTANGFKVGGVATIFIAGSIEIGYGMYQDGGYGHNAQRATASAVVGGVAGYGAAALGAKTGAIIGTLICPGLGTAIGAAIGGIGGGALGTWGGSWIGTTIFDTLE